MIVISGALVVIAIVLLVIGLFASDLGFVYGSIGVSLAAFVFLLIGVLQRRGESADGTDPKAVPAGSSEPAALEGVTTVIPARTADGEEPAVASRSAAAGTVLVVEGRPRYHVGSCRYLTGKDTREVEATDARAEGFTACGVCKPDAALEAAAAPAVDLTKGSEPEDTDADTGAAGEDRTPAVEVVEPAVAARRTTRAPATPATRAVPAPAPAAATRPAAARGAKAAPAPAAKAAPAAATAAPARTAARPAAKAAPARAAAKSAAKAAPAKAAAKPAAKKAPSPAAKAAAGPARGAATVVVIPSRGKFHTAECRYVRGAEDAETRTKTAASRAGFTACGVCNP